jgi:hypothetical protein
VDENGNQKIRLWRYLDLAKFTSLIQTKKLHCPRGDQFEDKFEGSYPVKNAKDFNDLGFKSEDWKNFVAISCRHESQHESDAMWRLYGLSKQGVAIVTTQNLLEELAENNHCYVQKVEYIDFSSDKADIYTPTFAFHYKRKAFVHENEIRLIKTKLPKSKDIISGVPIPSLPEEQNALSKGGCFLEIGNFSDFIKKIIVSPYAEPWFHDVVKNLTATYGINIEVSESELSGDPIYATP